MVPRDVLTCRYQELPGDPAGWPRPVLDLGVGGTEPTRVRCMVDSGASNTLLPAWVADLSGIDRAGAPELGLGVGGSGVRAQLVPTVLSVGEHSWEAEVGFCEPWPRGWGLLGQRSFFRYWVVTFRAADYELDLRPVAR